MNLRQKLKNNKLIIGSWVTIGHPSVVEVMATAGFEWLVIDMEHSAIGLETAQNLIAHIKAANLDALVRVGKNEEVIIKRVMDIGADGVIVPMINSREDALQAVNYVRYPPFGKRGVGLYRAQKYGIGFDEYKRWLKENSVIIAQIEHIKAVENIEDILSVEAIDGVIVGPYDLSSSIGYPGEYDRDDVKVALEKVKIACKKNKRPLGFHVITPRYEKLKEKIDEGYTFLAFSLDFLFLGDRAREEMEKVKEGLI